MIIWYQTRMNFIHLRTFVVVADAGGVHRAAARLHLSQPAVSRHIQALESELGVPLFDRIGRRVQLTSEGEDLLRRSRRLLAEAEAFTERAGAEERRDRQPAPRCDATGHREHARGLSA